MTKGLAAALFCLSFVSTACAAESPLAIAHAWARATAPGQEVGAAYMDLTSRADLTLTKVESPVAEAVEIHKMAMKDGVMEMRMLETLALPAGKTVKLEPGGFHLMLFELKKPLKTGERVAFTLHLMDATGKASTIKVDVPVKRRQE